MHYVKRVALWSLGLLLFAAVIVTAFLAIAGDNFYRWAAGRLLEGSIDRTIHFDGTFSFDVTLEPTLEALPELGPIMASGRLTGRNGTYRLDGLRFTIGAKNSLWIEASGALETLRPQQDNPLDGVMLKVTFALPSSKVLSQLIPPEVPELKNITGHFDVGGLSGRCDRERHLGPTGNGSLSCAPGITRRFRFHSDKVLEAQDSIRFGIDIRFFR